MDAVQGRLLIELSTLRSGVLKISVQTGCRVVVNNTKPVDQLILSSSREAGRWWAGHRG